MWRVLCCVFLLLCQGNRPAVPALGALNAHELATLETFFRTLIQDGGVGYTLFGDKPLSLFIYSLRDDTLSRPAEAVIMERGWALWQAYAECFPSTQFVLKRFYRAKEGICELWLIHKENVSKKIYEHAALFESAMGKEINVEELVNDICAEGKDVDAVLMQRSDLLGVLFGYGYSNAIGFEKKIDMFTQLAARVELPFSADKVYKTLSPRWQAILTRIAKHRDPVDAILPVKTAVLAQEFNELVLHEEGFSLPGSDMLLDAIEAPMFMIEKRDSEVDTIRASFDCTRSTLRRRYKQRAFLEVTLQQWMFPR